jgi:hypothetical protein
MSTPSGKDAFDGEALFANDPDGRLEGAFLAGTAIGRLKMLCVLGVDHSALAGPIDLFSIIASDLGWSSERIQRMLRCVGVSDVGGVH